MRFARRGEGEAVGKGLWWILRDSTRNPRTLNDARGILFSRGANAKELDKGTISSANASILGAAAQQVRTLL